MATKKKVPGKKSAGKKKPGASRKRPVQRRVAKPKPRRGARKAASRRGRKVPGEALDQRRRIDRSADLDVEKPEAMRGLGPEAGGQSGDIEGLSREELADSESVEELVEEGQAFEAGVVSGVENARDADRGEVRTRQVPEDDVPQEYLDED
jgi:hypothetical protein